MEELMKELMNLASTGHGRTWASPSQFEAVEAFKWLRLRMLTKKKRNQFSQKFKARAKASATS